MGPLSKLVGRDDDEEHPRVEAPGTVMDSDASGDEDTEATPSTGDDEGSAPAS